jgi:hypothetical protein
MAAGLPVVASPCGVQTEMVEHGVNGLLARSLDEWQSALLSLAADFALREKMGEAGTRRVITHFSTAATFAAMRSSLEALIESPGV